MDNFTKAKRNKFKTNLHLFCAQLGSKHSTISPTKEDMARNSIID